MLVYQRVEAEVAGFFHFTLLSLSCSASLTEFHDDVEGIAFLRDVPDSTSPKIGSRENLPEVPKVFSHSIHQAFP